MFKGNNFKIKENTTAALDNTFILLNEIRRFNEPSHHFQEL
jgi:hypothetical protein